MSDRWATKSEAIIESAPVLKQIGQLFINSVSGILNGWASDWEQDLFEYLNRELPVTCAYSFIKGDERSYYAIIHEPSSANILKLIGAYYKFLETKQKDDVSFYCEFLVFGEKEEKYLGIPQDARRLTSSLEADYAGKNRTLVEVHA